MAVKFFDKNNNVLWNGKPFFSLSFYHCKVTDKRLDKTAVNSFLSVITNDLAPFRKRNKAAFRLYWGKRRAYDLVSQWVEAQAGSPQTLCHYICDEPENVGLNKRDLELLNAVVKCSDPTKPTFLNVSANMASNPAILQITDLVGFDHYPIPFGRVADIGLTADNMRYNSNNRPVIFAPQAFSWGAYKKGARWPTPDEVSAMTFVGLIHNVKGLMFYEFPAPKMSSKTCIKDIKPLVWERLDHMLKTFKRISPALLGAEYAAEYKIEKMKNPPKVRIIVSYKGKDAYLLVTNPKETKCSVKIDFSSGVLADLKLSEDADYGCKIFPDGEGKYIFKFRPMGSAVFKLQSDGISKMHRLSYEETMAMLKKRIKHNANRPTGLVPFIKGSGVVPWRKALDLLDEWRSPRRAEGAKIIGMSDGLHIKVVTRHKVGRVSKVNKRDGAVWKDPCLEIFIGSPKKRCYAQLMVNTDNIQADNYVDQSKVDAFNAKINYKFDSKVNAGPERTEYELTIPWKEFRRMCKFGNNDFFLFNLATSKSDWSGLTGGGYHQPDRFGKLKIQMPK